MAKEHKVNPVKNIEMLKVKFGDDVDMKYLLECGYVNYSSYIEVKDKKIFDDFYSISAKGWAFLEHFSAHKAMILYPIITSTISAATAIAALLISIFKH